MRLEANKGVYNKKMSYVKLVPDWDYITKNKEYHIIKYITNLTDGG